MYNFLLINTINNYLFIINEYCKYILNIFIKKYLFFIKINNIYVCNQPAKAEKATATILEKKCVINTNEYYINNYIG